MGIRFVSLAELFDSHHQMIALGRAGVIFQIGILGKQRHTAVQLIENCEHFRGKLNHQHGPIPADIDGVQVAGIGNDQIVGIHGVLYKVDTDLVPIRQTDQNLHERMPVQLFEIGVVHMTGYIEIPSAAECDGFKIAVAEHGAAPFPYRMVLVTTLFYQTMGKITIYEIPFSKILCILTA